MFCLKPYSWEAAGQDLRIDVSDSKRPHLLTPSSCILLEYSVAIGLEIPEQGTKARASQGSRPAGIYPLLQTQGP